MHIKAFEHWAKELKLAEDLFNIRSSRQNGARGYSPDEVRSILTKTIESAGESKMADKEYGVIISDAIWQIS